VWISTLRWCQGNHQHPTVHLGAHQPTRRWLGRIKQRIADPDLVEVVDSEMWMLEQVSDMVIYFKGVVVIECIWVKWLSHLRKCIPNDYIWPLRKFGPTLMPAGSTDHLWSWRVARDSHRRSRPTS